MSDKKYSVIAHIYNEVASYAEVAVGDNYDGDEVGRKGDLRHTKLHIMEEIARGYEQGIFNHEEVAELVLDVNDITGRIDKFRRYTD